MKKQIVMTGSNLLLLVQLLCAQSTVSLTEPGAFVVGCNYWASHAGIHMWRDWQPEIIAADLKQLSAGNIRVIRVFPVWPDFQPITQYYGGGGSSLEIRLKEQPLPTSGPGANGLDTTALRHFRELADMAAQYHIKLVVGLVTGWMSGRLLVPPALEGKNILSDPVAIMWQVKFAGTFVRTFKDHPAIIAWDLGNECNVMEDLPSHEAAWLWTASIANAVRAEDKSRPVVSGMHGLSFEGKDPWRLADQAELTDLLTTHPYPMWTPHAGMDPKNGIRTCIHSAAESRLYADAGNKPCIAEEIGMMGPMEANEEVTAAFARTTLFSLWANNCQGFLWWCAYDQSGLGFPPYEWQAVERNLGLIRPDRTPKPVFNELKKFAAFTAQLPFTRLPVRKTNAVCILTGGQDQWGVAYSAYILAKQAGLELSFQYATQPLKSSSLYILPSINGITPVSRTTWLQLLDKVKEGAVLYVSCNEGFLSPFNEPAGIDIITRTSRREHAAFISLTDTSLHFEMPAASRFAIRPTTAQVLATEADHNPVFMTNNYGKGRICFLTIPLEDHLANTPGVFEEKTPYYKIYSALKQYAGITATVSSSDPAIAFTTHDISASEKIIIGINYSAADATTNWEINKAWTVSKLLYGQAPSGEKCVIKANDAFVVLLKRN
jgi:beta-galactosidase